MYNRKDERITGLFLGIPSLVLTVHVFFWYLGNPQQFIEHRLGISSDAFNNPTVWIFTFIIVIGYVMYTAEAVPFVREHLFTFSWLKVIGIWAALIFSILDEILFRQILMYWLLSLDYSINVKIISLIINFCLEICFLNFLKREFKISFPVIMLTKVFGGLLAILYLIAYRNILAPIVAHILINLFIEPWLILSAVSGKWNSGVKESGNNDN